MLLTLVSFIVVLGVIVIIHELGHFLAARLTGMRVKKFSIGFPPRIISKTIGDTEYSLSWIPLGGYVQIAGMVDESMEDSPPTGAPDEFMSKNAFQKIFVLSAGVIMNYLLAFVLIAGITAAMGTPEVKSAKVGEVMKDMPADAAGVHVGDQIVAVNDQPTSTWDDVVKAITSASDTITLMVRRVSGEVAVLRVPTIMNESPAGKRHVIGVSPEISYRSASFGEIVGQGWRFCYQTTAGVAGFLGGIFTGESHISQLSGPLGVARLSGESVRQGSGAFLFFIAYVSVSIGALNLVPFPVLDGGHIVYVIIEGIIRRPIPTRAKLWIQQVGMALIILLVLIVSYHDIMRMFTN